MLLGIFDGMIGGTAILLVLMLAPTLIPTAPLAPAEEKSGK